VDVLALILTAPALDPKTTALPKVCVPVGAAAEVMMVPCAEVPARGRRAPPADPLTSTGATGLENIEAEPPSMCSSRVIEAVPIPDTEGRFTDALCETKKRLTPLACDT
jgi:hypothetical protein